MSGERVRMAQWPSGEPEPEGCHCECYCTLPCRQHPEYVDFFKRPGTRSPGIAAKQEIDRLVGELAKCREAGMAIEQERRRQVKLNQWQADVVEAARLVLDHEMTVETYNVIRVALDTLDKAQQADEAEIWNK